MRRLSAGSAGLLRDGKTTTWEGGVREPGIVRWPGVLRPRVTPAVAATYDIYATALRLAGVALPADRVVDGKDLVPLLLDPKARPERRPGDRSPDVVSYRSARMTDRSLAPSTEADLKVLCSIRGRSSAASPPRSSSCGPSAC